MLEPRLGDVRDIMNRIADCDIQRDQICLEETPPWSPEVLEKFDEIKYWKTRYTNTLKLMLDQDRSGEWHGG